MRVISIEPAFNDNVLVTVERSVLWPMQVFGIKPTQEIYRGKNNAWLQLKPINRVKRASPAVAQFLTAKWEEYVSSNRKVVAGAEREKGVGSGSSSQYDESR